MYVSNDSCGHPRSWGAAGRLLLLATVLSFGVAACGGGQASFEGPYANDFQYYMDHATSDFEREVLSDGVITRAEYEEANQRYLTCMYEFYPPDGPDRAKNFPNRTGTYDHGIEFSWEHSQSADFEDLLALYQVREDSCMKDNVLDIHLLYGRILDNPEGITQESLEVQRLIACGLVGPEYSINNYIADEAFGFGYVEGKGIPSQDEFGNPTGDYQDPAEIWHGFDPTAATGLDITAEDVMSCVNAQ